MTDDGWRKRKQTLGLKRVYAKLEKLINFIAQIGLYWNSLCSKEKY
jgi:hypothetical protein